MGSGGEEGNHLALMTSSFLSDRLWRVYLMSAMANSLALPRLKSSLLVHLNKGLSTVYMELNASSR